MPTIFETSFYTDSQNIGNMTGGGLSAALTRSKRILIHPVLYEPILEIHVYQVETTSRGERYEKEILGLQLLGAVCRGVWPWRGTGSLHIAETGADPGGCDARRFGHQNPASVKHSTDVKVVAV